MTNTQKTLCLIDGSGFIFRAFYALPPLSRPDGTPVGAVFGFTSMLMNLIETHRHDLWAVIFDAKRQNFRHDLFPDYKANRASPPPELIPQFSLIREVCKAFDVPAIEMEGYEADDLIATYAHQAVQDGYHVTIVSGDKDLMQLMSPEVELIDPIKNRRLTEEDVIKKFGVKPEKVADVQALMGDSTDNIPGIPGVGPKTASELITIYGDLESLLKNAHTIAQVKRRELIQTHADAARLSKKLVLLKSDVPVMVPYQQLKPEPMNHDKIMGFINDQGFHRLKSRVLTFFTAYAAESTLIPSAVQGKFSCISTLEALQEAVNIIQTLGCVAIDTETDGLNTFECNLIGISLSWDKENGVYIPINHKDADGTKLDGQLLLEDLRSLLGPILQNSGILKIGHNVKFDAEVLAAHGLPLDKTISDTMVMSYTLDMGRNGHGLDELALKYFNYSMISYKEAVSTAPKINRKEATFDYVSIDAATTYAAEDAWMTFILHDALKKRLLEEKATNLYQSLDRPLVQVIIAMESEGIKIDVDYLNQLTKTFEDNCKQLERHVFQLAGQEFNLGSPKQLSEILFEHLNLPTDQKKGKSGHYSTDSDVLEGLVYQGHQIAEYLLAWRQYNKLITTYTRLLPEKINPKTGRVHTSFGLTITTTGRLSSSDPNLQNIPIRTEEGRLIRKAFIAAPGYKLVSFDYSQIELRLLAHIANISELKEAFHHNQDIHTLTASHVLGISVDQVTSEQRRSAKAINFGIVYGISAFGLSNQLGVSKSQAQGYIDAYFQRYPGIKAYMESTVQHARAHGYVTTLLGHKAYIQGLEDRNYAVRNYAERQAINAPIQGSNADIIKKAMIQIFDQITKHQLSARMLLQVHDELVFEIPDENVNAEIPIIKNIMESTVKISIPIVVDYGAALNWADAH
jgi:DNA polymerase I